MKRPNRWLAITYHGRAIFRSLLALWYGLLSDVEDWFSSRSIVAELPPVRVAVYPRRGPASPGQIAEYKVVLLRDEQGHEVVPFSEAVEQYLWKIEGSMPPLPTERHSM